MPTGVKIITTLNIVLASLFVSNLLYLHKSAQSAPLLVFVNLVSAGTLILITLIVLLRLIRLVGFARVLAYALILVLGLQLLLTLKYLMTGYGALIVLIDLVVIIYAIGMRGYLASDKAASYFLRNSI
jgi:hypothetical protein